jgi:pilus assembly protein CpaB
MAAVIGGLTSWYVYRSLGEKIASSRQAEVDVVVAAQDIRVGERLEDRNLRVVNYREEFLPAGVPHRRQGAVGRVAVLPIAKGEFVLPYKIGSEGPGDRLTAQIPVGMRAIQVPVNEFDSSSIKSGDRVDVLVTGNATGSNDTQTKTVLPNVRLLAIGSRVVTLRRL